MLRFPLVKGGAPAVRANAVAWLETAGSSPSTTSTAAVAEDGCPFTESVALAVPRPIPALASNCRTWVPSVKGNAQVRVPAPDGPSTGSGAASPSTLAVPGT